MNKQERQVKMRSHICYLREEMSHPSIIGPSLFFSFPSFSHSTRDLSVPLICIQSHLFPFPCRLYVKNVKEIMQMKYIRAQNNETHAMQSSPKKTLCRKERICRTKEICGMRRVRNVKLEEARSSAFFYAGEDEQGVDE